MKASGLAITAAAIVIVAILALGLLLGFGIIQGRTSTVTSTEIMTQTVGQTQIQVESATETVLSTVSPPPAIVTTTTTETSVSPYLSQSTVTVASTVNRTEVESETVYQTTTQEVTTTANGYVVLLPQGSLISFSTGQSYAIVPLIVSRVGYNGFLQIIFDTINSTSVHWVLEGNLINETSLSQSSGSVEFPVQANIAYSLFVYNDECANFICSTPAFNVSATVAYEY